MAMSKYWTIICVFVPIVTAQAQSVQHRPADDDVVFLQLSQSPSSEAENGHGDAAAEAAQATDLFDAPAEVLECFSRVQDELFTSGGLNEACEGQCGSILSSGGHAWQLNAYYEYVARSSVKTVCETGFYNGVSAALWMCSNPEAVLHSFDLEIPRNLVAVLERNFGDRFHWYEGNSLVTLSKFANKEDAPFCDLMIMDGGHYHPVPDRDLANFAKLAARQPTRQHMLVIDEIFYLGEDGCCADMQELFVTLAQRNRFDTTLSHCYSGQTGTEYNIGAKDFGQTYPAGGWCSLSFSSEYLMSVNVSYPDTRTFGARMATNDE